MSNKQKTIWWIDLVLFAVFITTFFMDLTGIEAHQWIGILCGTLAAYHLFLHLGWVEAVTGRFFTMTSGQARRYYSLDALLLMGFALIGITGLVISSWLNLPLSNFPTWLKIHITTSIATLMVLLLKLSLHWRWIVNTSRKIWAGQFMAPVNNSAADSTNAASSHVGRREFLHVMGIAGAVSLLALVNATKSLAEAGSTAVELAANESAESGTTSSLSSSSSARDCTVRCQKACSFPGHCHRYIDINNNNRCDLGECT